MPLVKKNLFKSADSASLGYSTRSLIIIIAFAIILLGSIGTAVFFYRQYQITQSELNRSTQSNEQAVLIAEVGKLIVLPSGEQPSIATVSDINRLRGQSFFVHARNGDKVLIYSKAQEAILYDPVANKIVSVGPISLTQITPTPRISGSVAAPVPVTVALYNGTTTVGLTATVAQQLKTKLPDVTVVSRNNAQKDTYVGTIVVDTTGKDASQASQLAKILGGKVGKLPTGEEKPQNAELMVILGK